MAGLFAAVGDVFRGVANLTIGEALTALDLTVGAVDGVDDLLEVKRDLGTAALDDLHVTPPRPKFARDFVTG